MSAEAVAPKPHRRLSYSVQEAAEVTGVGRSLLYEEIAAGHLVARKVGSKRTVILAADLEAWLNALPIAEAFGRTATVEGALDQTQG